jgi:hypothetical protein
MRQAGVSSWLISVDEWDQQLEWALWIRAAERIHIQAGEAVTGPPDVDPLPEPSLSSGGPLAGGWLWWWKALLARPAQSGRPVSEFMADLARFGPPDFDGLIDYPELRQVVTARWSEANAWHSARKRAGVEAFRASSGQHGREGAIVRAVEAEIGHKAAPFELRIIVLPVLDSEIRPAGSLTFLVPERMRVTSAYADWLRQVVRALA